MLSDCSEYRVEVTFVRAHCRGIARAYVARAYKLAVQVLTQHCCMQMKAMQVQHDQVMRNLRSSQMVEMRRTLRNQAADISRQHHTEAEWLARGDLIIARDRALLELQDLQQAHSDLQAKVTCAECSSQCNTKYVTLLASSCTS